MGLRQNKNSHLFMIGGPYAWGEIPDTQAFGFDPQRKVERRGNNTFGGRGPVAITDNYEGVTGSFEVEGTRGEKTALAYANRKQPSAFINDPPHTNMPIYLVSKDFDDDGVTPLGGSVIDTAKIGNKQRGVRTGNVQFPFEALTYAEVFDKEIIIQEFDGEATAVTTLDLSDDAAPLDDGNGGTFYAILVLIQAQNSKQVKRLTKGTAAAAGVYTETASAITLHSSDGLGPNTKAIVVYAKA
ncbi:hypothetical protein H1S01_03350 [Heliobacterium chlorum]|uniref:Uncharacterized protein n=1 Tax=Heliobacterium chlorum TaxID=2698 RepID=A0ABR7T0P0_HELCL|nr:hypothetical protein [Heliobacterium chlorum]MBC9783548.1 hypothetical protein [Heliobacterium chlorum]